MPPMPKGLTLHSNGEDFAVETSPGKFVPEIDPVTRQPTGKAQRFVMAPTATLSSRERSARMDEAIRVVNANAKALEELRRKVEALDSTCRQNALRVDRDIDDMNGRISNNNARLQLLHLNILGRLRWLFFGLWF